MRNILKKGINVLFIRKFLAQKVLVLSADAARNHKVLANGTHAG